VKTILLHVLACLAITASGCGVFDSESGPDFDWAPEYRFSVMENPARMYPSWFDLSIETTTLFQASAYTLECSTSSDGRTITIHVSDPVLSPQLGWTVAPWFSSAHQTLPLGSWATTDSVELVFSHGTRSVTYQLGGALGDLTVPVEGSTSGNPFIVPMGSLSGLPVSSQPHDRPRFVLYDAVDSCDTGMYQLSLVGLDLFTSDYVITAKTVVRDREIGVTVSEITKTDIFSTPGGRHISYMSQCLALDDGTYTVLFRYDDLTSTCAIDIAPDEIRFSETDPPVDPLVAPMTPRLVRHDPLNGSEAAIKRDAEGCNPCY
jgi:hypothetical protein